MEADSTVLQLLLAFIAGGGLTALVTVGTRRAEFRREDQLRWIADKRAAYARLLDAISEVSTAMGLAGLMADQGPEFTREWTDKALAAHISCKSDFATLRILAPERVTKELDELQKAETELVKLFILAPAIGPLTREAVEDALDAVNERSAAFVGAARADMRA